MQAIMGTTWPAFIGFTLVIMGFAAFMTGQGLAGTWRPAWHAVPYAFMLGAADRFLTWGLFGGELLSLTGYLIHSVVLLVICLFAYRLTQAHKMVMQYPWLYERAGLLSWRSKRP
jgi:hypothetical protein